MGAAHRLLMPQFRPPSPRRIAKALGDTSNPKEEPPVKSLLEMGKDDPAFFPPIPVPGMQDWLANHPERGQTFDDWFTVLGKNDVQYGPRRVIYVLPILKSGLNQKENPSRFLQLLKEYAEAFFVGLTVMMLPSVSSEEMGCKTRVHEVITGVKREQMLARDILKYIQKDMPYDAYCVIGVTMIDLYPEESWNFVFGMASLVNRCGIFSFARYHPNFLDTKDVNDTMESILELPPDLLRLGLRRSFEILTHEVSHMFGIQHCIYFACLMNGSNHQKESDSRPIFLCPVCLRKLKHAINFDVAKRYEGMLRVFRSLDEQFPLPKEEEIEAEATSSKQEEQPTAVKQEGEATSTELEQGGTTTADQEEGTTADLGEEATSTEKEVKNTAEMEVEVTKKEVKTTADLDGEATSTKEEDTKTASELEEEAVSTDEESETAADMEGEEERIPKDVDKINECIRWLTKTTEYLATVES